MTEEHYTEYDKWLKRAYEQRYGKGSWEERERTNKDVESGPVNLVLYEPDIKRYWDEEKALGVLERNNKFIGIACLVAKEVVDKESYVRRFGLSFEKDVQWHAVSSLLDYLARSPMFKAVLVTTSKIPFKLESDIPEEIKGRMDWARRNYNFHKDKANTLKIQIEQQSGTFGIFPKYLPKQMKEESEHARKFLET